jgi:hypothetical protein
MVEALGLFSGENLGLSFFKSKRTADGSADRHAWSSGTMGENAGA